MLMHSQYRCTSTKATGLTSPSTGLTAICTLEPPHSTPISRMMATEASRKRWYSLSVRVCEQQSLSISHSCRAPVPSETAVPTKPVMCCSSHRQITGVHDQHSTPPSPS